MLEFELRPWRMEDIDCLVKYANNPKISDNLTDGFPYPYTKEKGSSFLKMATSATPPNIMAIIINGEAAGGIGIHPKQDVDRLNAELGYWVAEKYWGQGIMSRAIPLMMKYAFENFDVNRIFARPYEHNIASHKVLLKAGFKLEGRFKKNLIKKGVLLDEFIYALRKEDF